MALLVAADIPFYVLGVYLLIAAIIDIKTHEVPDWISYSLVALGICYAATLSLLVPTARLEVAWSVLGALIGFGLGAALYYSGQWGGGDAKLLAGVGALLGLNGQWFLDVAHGTVPFWRAPAFIWFLLFALVGGAIYGICWMLVLIARNPKRFFPAFRTQLAKMRWQRLAVIVVTLSIIALTVYVYATISSRLALPVLGLAALVFFSFYLAVAVQTVEQTLMHVPIKAKELTEGDWVIGGLKIKGKWIIPARNIGATLEQIALAKKLGPNQTVIVKQGIPFVPSFFIAYVGIFLLGQF